MGAHIFIGNTNAWDIGIYLSSVNEYKLSAYCSADWGGDVIDRQRQSGYLVYIGDMLISWGSRKQSTVARSSTESE